MKTTIIFATLALACGGAALAGDKDQRDPNQVICKNQKRTDSRFGTRICHTRAEWVAIAEENKRSYGEQRDRPMVEIRRDN